jgi:dipeptidyl aminopeptidase/acylaminoacyl peptidase
VNPSIADREKRFLQLEDMWQMVFVSSPTVSADGKRVVFARYTAVRATGKFASRLYEVASDGGAVREVEAGAGNASCPAFSPCGSGLAFLSDASGEKQIWLIDDPNAAALRQVTTMRHGVESFAWSPDGTRLAFNAALFPDETPAQAQSEMTAAERREFEWRRENMPVVVEKLMYKFDETFGLADGSFRQIGVVPAEGGKAIVLTGDAMLHDGLAWSPDGKQLAFFGYPYGHGKATRKELFVIPSGGGPARQLTRDSVYIGDNPAVFTPGGEALLYSCLKAGQEEGFVLKLRELSLEDGSDACLFPEQEVCHGVDPMAVGKSVYGKRNPAIQLSECGKLVYFTSGWQGCTHIHRLNLDGDPVVEQVTCGPISVTSFCRPVGDELIYTRGDLMSLDDVYCRDLSTG